MTISYLPSTDELVLKSRPLTQEPSKDLGSFKLWWDDNGQIYGFNISHYTEELQEFKKHLNTVRLGGIWKGAKITEQEITEMRQELLDKLEEKW